MRRHVVIAHGWDEATKKGWMRFRCRRCGHEYQMTMIHKLLRETFPPAGPGLKSTWRRKPYSKLEIERYSSWWSEAKGQGVSVSECGGMSPASQKSLIRSNKFPTFRIGMLY